MSRSSAIPALRSVFAVTTILGFASAASLAAEEQALLPEEPASLSETLTVSANRDEAQVDEVGSTVTIIDREEIERRNTLYVGDLLRTVPGFELTQTGGPGQVASARLRGGTAAQTLVLIDGVRVNTATNGDVDFSHLQSAGIERIEVLRGPQATYGSEAVAV